MKRLMMVAAVLAAGTFSALAAKQDGTYWNAEGGNVRKTGEPAYWVNRIIAAEGGTATFADAPANYTLNNTISGWTLGALHLNGFCGVVTNMAISLTGEAEVSGTGSPVFRCTLQAAEATATLTKRGTGTLTLSAPLAGFAGVSILNGELCSTNEAGAAVADAPVSFYGGALCWTPGAAEGASVSAALGGEALKVRGYATLRVERGKAASATLTVPPLDLAERNPLLVLLPTGGSAALGDAVKVTPSGAAPETANGCIDPRIVSRSTAAGNAFCFLACDAQKGLVPAAADGAITDADAASKIVTINADTTLPDGAKAGALVVEGTPVVTGTTLAVGDGQHAAGVIFNATTKETTDFTGVGTLAFGDAPAVIWQNNADSNNGLWQSAGGKVCLPTITGTKGLTLASAKKTGYCIFKAGADGKKAAGWTGPTRIAGSVRYEHQSADCLPANGEVYVEGGELYTVSHLVYPTQRFSFSSKGGAGSAYRTGGSPDIYFDGLVTLPDTAYFAHDNNGAFWFRKGLEGKGGIVLQNNGRLCFTAPCTFEGGVTAESTTRCVFVQDKGTLGTGPVVAQGSRADDCGALQMQNNFGDNRAIIEHPNRFTVTGSGLDLKNSCVAFPGGLSSTRTRWTDRTRVGVGEKVALGELSGTGKLDFYAIADESALTFSVTNSRALAFDTADGADGKALSIAKKGAGTLTLSGHHTHTGETIVEEGTLKVESSPFKSPSLRYWLDASDESTITTDANGSISEWRSKTGSMTFTPPHWTYQGTYSFYGPTYTETLNDRKVVSFRSDKDHNIYERLLGSESVPNRHLFMVIRIKGNQTGNSGFFGAYLKDYGLRVAYDGAIECTPTGGQYPTRYMRINGVEKGSPCYYTVDKYFLFEAFHDEYDGNSSATKLTDFQPILGGYFQWSPWRNLDFDLAELIAFDSILPDAERVAVENYLQAKWAVPDCARQSEVAYQTLSAASDLVLASESATLDLNGSNETVKNLSGCGRIINSGAAPATLTVKGACTFRGTTGENVVLKIDSTEKSKIETPNSLPVREGIAFWVDASYKPEEYVKTNAEGRVTDWLCRAGTVAKFQGVVNGGVRTLPHGWSATGLAGVKPAVFFDGSNVSGEAFGDSLAASGACSVRTFFLVVQYVKSCGNTGFFGKNGADVGFRCCWSPAFRTGDGLTGWGDEISVNGTDYTGNVNASLEASGVSVVAVRCACDRPNLINQTVALGQYVPWNVGMQIQISEALAYDRRLTDGEYLAVKQYLDEKWAVDTPLPEDEEGQPRELANVAFGPSCATLAGDYVAKGGWTFDFGSLEAIAAPLLTVEGTLALGGATASFVRHGNLTRDEEFTYLAATAIEGDFAATDLDDKHFDRKADAWKQTLTRFRPGSLLLVW